MSERLGKRATILLVEDHEAVLRAMRKCLENKGYHLLEARDGKEALTVAKSFPKKIDILVTDLAMEPMNGKDLVRLLAPLRPEMQLVITSGFAEETVARQGLSHQVTVLHKPFLPQRLVGVIEDLLVHSPQNAGRRTA